MIRLPSPLPAAPETQYALALLVDHARLLPSEQPGAVELRVAPDSASAELLDAAGQVRVSDDLMAECGQHVFQMQRKQDFILDDQNPLHCLSGQPVSPLA